MAATTTTKVIVDSAGNNNNNSNDKDEIMAMAAEVENFWSEIKIIGPSKILKKPCCQRSSPKLGGFSGALWARIEKNTEKIVI